MQELHMLFLFRHFYFLSVPRCVLPDYSLRIAQSIGEV